MKIDKQFFEQLKKQIEKDFGKKCWHPNNHKIKDYCPLCEACQIWLAYETMRDLYEIDKFKEKDTIKK